MKRIITPDIFLSAATLAGCAHDAANIEGIDLGDTSDSLQEKLYSATTSPDDVRLAGERSFVDSLGTADQVFTRVP